MVHNLDVKVKAMLPFWYFSDIIQQSEYKNQEPSKNSIHWKQEFHFLTNDAIKQYKHLPVTEMKIRGAAAMTNALSRTQSVRI